MRGLTNFSRKYFKRGQIDKSLFIKTKGKKVCFKMISKEDKLMRPFSLKQREKTFCLSKYCIDDILFGASNGPSCKEFSKFISKEFEMSMVEELKLFVGLQIKQY